MDAILGKLVRGEINEAEAKRQLGLLTGAEASRFRTEGEMDAVIAQARANPGQYRNVYAPVDTAEPVATEGGVRGVIPSTEAESARKAYGLLETEAGGPGLLRGGPPVPTTYGHIWERGRTAWFCRHRCPPKHLRLLFK